MDSSDGEGGQILRHKKLDLTSRYRGGDKCRLFKIKQINGLCVNRETRGHKVTKDLKAMEVVWNPGAPFTVLKISKNKDISQTRSIQYTSFTHGGMNYETPNCEIRPFPR